MLPAILKLSGLLIATLLLGAPLICAQTEKTQDMPVVATGELQFDVDLLADVEDRTRGIRDSERDAYFQVLQYAESGDNQRQQEAARVNLKEFERQFEAQQKQVIEKNPKQPRYRFSLYADLLNHPQNYRGKLLTLRGHIRRLEEMPLIDGERDLGIAYQAYLFTEDSRTHPYIIICRSVPPEMPRGGDVMEEVEVTGYFFKIYAYDAQDTARVAPLVIAQRLNWFPQEESKPLVSPLLGSVIAGAVLLILVLILWRISIKDRQVREEQLRKMAEHHEPFSSSEL